MAGHWDSLEEALRQRLNPQKYGTWVRQMTCVCDDGQRLVIGLPSSFSLDWVANHYQHVLQEELARIAPGAALELELAPGADGDALAIREAVDTPSERPERSTAGRGAAAGTRRAER